MKAFSSRNHQSRQFQKLMPYLFKVCAGFALAFVSLQTSAADYCFKMQRIDNWEPTACYPSAGESCQAATDIVGGDSYILHPYASNPVASCEVLSTTGHVAGRFIDKYGNACPVGKFFNAARGHCESSEESKQKGIPGGKSRNEPSSCAGNPINLSNGNKYQLETDFQSAVQSGLRFYRLYNSNDGLWRHNFSTSLRFSGALVILVRADGRESVFTLQGSNYSGSADELGQLIQAEEGWTYLSPQNQRLTFDSLGRLKEQRSEGGRLVHLTYSGAQATVSDDTGQAFSITSDGPQPLSFTKDNLVISYTYTSYKLLTKVTRTQVGAATQRNYSYSSGSAPYVTLLTGITDERGVRHATWTYDSLGRAISSEHAGGTEKTLVSYNADGSTTVTNPLGKQTTYQFQTIQGVKHITSIQGEPSPSCPMSNSTFTYDDRGLLTSKTDNKGLITTYDYNARGLEISRTEAAGTPQARTTTTIWHPALYLPLTVTEPGRITTYTYDAQGRQLSRSSVGTAL